MQPALATDRTKLRMERLRQLELEQLQWEQDALVMPEDLDRALALSFASVKTEFSDLDGLSWSRYPVPPVANPWAVEQPTPKLTCVEIDAFPTPPDPPDARAPVHSPTHPPPPSRPDASQDTIRVSRLAQSSRGPSHRPGSPYALPPANLALACHGLRHPSYRHS